jgi:oligopeptide transport system substrate-binding protein
LTFSRDYSQYAIKYLENSTELVFQEEQENLIPTAADETHFFPHPRAYFILFSPALPPLDDVRVRKALVLALDREELLRTCDIQRADGGLIPPGIPGHSPDLGVRFDIDAARQLLAEAGYPEGKGFPSITGLSRHAMRKVSSIISRQWKTNLGIEVSMETKSPQELKNLRAQRIQVPFVLMGWLADYPDPDNILGQPNAFLHVAHFWGWHDEAYHRLVFEAGRTPNQKRRMEMYRQADRILIQEQVLALPISYGGTQTRVLVKPWVKNLQITPTGRILIKDIVVEDH